MRQHVLCQRSVGISPAVVASTWALLPLLSLHWAAGCGSNTTATPDASTEDAVAERVDARPETADARVEVGLSFEHDWQEQALCAVEGWFEPDCCSDARIALPPIAASAFDLRSLAPGAMGTCGNPVKLFLPADPAAYPLMVLLPEVVAADPNCAACSARGKETAFGVVLELPDSIASNYRPMVVAPPPWKYVYDHNSNFGDACLGGYQEFGERSCVRTNYGGAIGFATGSVTSGRAALIDLQAGQGPVDTCCPYLPTAL